MWARSFICANMALHRTIMAVKERRDHVKAELHDLKKHIQKLNTTTDDASCSSTTSNKKRRTMLAPKYLDTAILLYHGGEQGEGLCTQYLQYLSRSKTQFSSDISNIMSVIQQSSKETSVELVHTNGWWNRRHRDAQKYLSEQKLYEWVQKENDQSGLAPTTRRVCSPQLGTSTDYTLPNGMPPVSTCTPISKRMKQWTRRWARRFHLRRGYLGSTANVSKSDMTAKAPKSEQQRSFRDISSPP